MLPPTDAADVAAYAATEEVCSFIHTYGFIDTYAMELLQ
jgi:hypothetical protein